MNFDDLLGLMVFLGIIIISSVLRGLKEMRKKEEGKLPKTPTQPQGKEFKEPTNIPKRKVIIRKETEPGFPLPPVFAPIPETLETKEDIFEKMEEGEGPVLIKLEKSVTDEPQESPIRQEKPLILIEKKDADTIKVKSKHQKQKEEKPSTAKIQKVAVSAPMKRVSTPYLPSSSISLEGNIGNIPKLQWAIIMTEVLGPPKALRND